MKITTPIFLVLGLVLHVHCAITETNEQEEQPNKNESQDVGILGCMFTDDSVNCLGKRLARDLDRMERDVTGKNDTRTSAVVEQAGNIVAEIIDNLRRNSAEEIVEEYILHDDKDGNTEQTHVLNSELDTRSRENKRMSRGFEESRKKKFSKKKLKHLQKLLGLVMLLKAKLSLLLQLISTHFQFKFFIIAIISLMLNAARFWIEIKKSPSKVVYYEHAQHQHHYDHDDHGYWGRSSNDTPQELAYHAYVPTE